MSTSAIIMMIIGCGGLWGGCVAASVYYIKHNKKEKAAQAEKK